MILNSVGENFFIKTLKKMEKMDRITESFFFQINKVTGP
jgi:hypothetical protein